MVCSLEEKSFKMTQLVLSQSFKDDFETKGGNCMVL